MIERPAVVVFAKAPRTGLVKTRLCPPLSSQQAAELYACMLEDVLVTTAGVAVAHGFDAVLALHPGDAMPEVLPITPAVFRVVAQRGRDLPERMTWAAAEAAAGGAAPLVLRGSDSPVLDGDRIVEAVERLTDCDLVISPDADGGYNLIALRSPMAGLFEHAISTRRVLEDTLSTAAAAGLRCELLEPAFDLDTASDLERLADERDATLAARCPRTLAYLYDRALWPAAQPVRSAPI